MWHYFILGVPLAFACAVQPGPFQAYIIAHTLERGWRRSWFIAFAPLFSDIPAIVVAVLILRQLPGWLMYALQCAGGALLIVLAVLAWRSRSAAATAPGAGVAPFFKAVLVNLLNPNPFLGWSLVMGPLLIQGWRASPSQGLALLLGFYLTLIVGLLAIIALVAAAGSVGAGVRRVLIIVSVIALGIFGVYTIWSGVGNLLRI